MASSVEYDALNFKKRKGPGTVVTARFLSYMGANGAGEGAGPGRYTRMRMAQRAVGNRCRECIFFLCPSVSAKR